MTRTDIDIEELKNAYEDCKNLHKLSNRFHISHIKISALLKENGVKINNVGKRRDISEEELSCMIEDYEVNNLNMEEISKKYGVRLKRLRSMFKERCVNVSKWHGHIKKEKTTSSRTKKMSVQKREHKTCPYCGWKTYDIENKSSAFVKHMKKAHADIPIEEHIEKFPSDEKYFIGYERFGKKVRCEICGKEMCTIDDRHLIRKHGITKAEYMARFPHSSTVSDKTREKLRMCMEKMNENGDWQRKTSNGEEEIRSFIESLGYDTVRDRSILGGKEIDIYVPSKRIGIEFNGNKWHTEWYGRKGRMYHLEKTKTCNSQGVRLIQIFEDEYKYRKDVVLSKIRHILGADVGSEKIMARKCTIKDVEPNIAENFLENNHVQGFVSSSLYYGAFFEGRLIGVMSFKDWKHGNWELTRFATVNGIICQGIGGKLLKHFIRNNEVSEIKSFADRRWTLDKDDNIYTRLGFSLVCELKPDYRYYNEKVDKFKRFHKFGFRKSILSKRYGFDMSMTETEMVRRLGYDRIWDCGLLKYVLKV